jgi:hypothetical protein
MVICQVCQTLSLTVCISVSERFVPIDDINVKFTLEQAMKAQRGSRGTDLFFL